MDIEIWKEHVEIERKNKDIFFRGYQSPMSFEYRETFKGLDYYPPDRDLIITPLIRNIALSWKLSNIRIKKI